MKTLMTIAIICSIFAGSVSAYPLPLPSTGICKITGEYLGGCHLDCYLFYADCHVGPNSWTCEIFSENDKKIIVSDEKNPCEVYK